MILKSFNVEKNQSNIKNFKSILIYGENGGLRDNIKELIKKGSKEGEYINFFQDEIIKNKNLLKDEVINGSLFNVEKIIFIHDANDKIYDHLQEILINIKGRDKIIILSNLLDKKSKLRNLFERSKNQLVSIAFYPDSNEILLKIAQRVFREKKISLSSECINLIVDKCAGDRKNLFNEIDKIQLYLKDKNNITNDEIFKLINLSENHSIDDLINNCLAKKQKKLLNILNDNIFAYEDCIIIIRTLLKKTKILLNLINKFNLNNDIEKTINNAKPPIFWKDKNIIKDQINLWSVKKIKNLIIEINDIELQIKKNSFNAINFTTNFLLEKSK